MVYKRLLINISIRIILLSLTLFAIVYFWMGNRDPLILLNLLVIFIFQVYLFIRSQNQVNGKLRAFFEAFRFDDLAFTAVDGFRDRSFRDLYASMTGILEKAREMSLENLRQKQYFQSVTEHAGVGILACNENQKVRMANRTFRDLFGIGELSQLGELDGIREGLSGQLLEISPGSRKLIRLSVPNPADILGETQMQLSVRCTEIKLEEEKIRLLTFQNIHQELEEKEVESWQRVIRVLTHEITNSAGPLASAAQTLQELLEQDRSMEEPEGGISGIKEDLLEGLKIIRERSTGMEEFVQEFRKLTLIPEPRIEQIAVKELFQSISVLFEKRFKEEEIKFDINLDKPDMVLYADRNLSEQALINLISNAVEALKQSAVKTIRLDARGIPGRQCSISVTDNGVGIREEDLDKVFVPFYTSRKDGSGIGLSMIRNIMKLHRGSIQVFSDPGNKTTFRMLF